MKYLNSVFTVIAVISFSSTSVFAMEAFLEKTLKNKYLYKIPKRFFSDKIAEKNIPIHQKIKKTDIKKILETPIIAKEKPVFFDLPKDFFIENRDNVIVERVNERIMHVHQNITLEKELSFKNVIKKKDNKNDDKHRALLTEQDGKIIDRRIKVKDPTIPQYLPICHLHIFYKLNDQDSLVFSGSGFRNSFNQIITAGHNLYIEQKDVEEYYKKKNINYSQKFSFDKNFFSIQMIFGYNEEEKKTKYLYTLGVNGIHCFNHPTRDLGIIQLPFNKKELLDGRVGSLPIMSFPDQPHEYKDKDITIVGYPGEIDPPSLYFHSGPIKYVNPNKEVFYDVDTTGGNSGSPGFPKLILEENVKKIVPVFLTHTHASYNDNSQKAKVNAGAGYDEDFYDFMAEHIN